MADIVARLREADTGWSGDAACVAAEVASEGANEIVTLRDRIAALEAGLRQTSGALENLYAMCNGEVPSLLEDHHSVPKIEAAIGMATALLSPDAAAGVVVPHEDVTDAMIDAAMQCLPSEGTDAPYQDIFRDVYKAMRRVALLGREGG